MKEMMSGARQEILILTQRILVTMIDIDLEIRGLGNSSNHT